MLEQYADTDALEFGKTPQKRNMRNFRWRQSILQQTSASIGVSTASLKPQKVHAFRIVGAGRQKQRNAGVQGKLERHSAMHQPFIRAAVCRVANDEAMAGLMILQNCVAGRVVNRREKRFVG